MDMRRSRFRTVATIVAGFVAGAIGAALVPVVHARRHADPAGSDSRIEVRNVPDPVERARQMMTEARLHALEVAAAAQPASGPRGPEPPAAATEEPAAAPDTRAYHERRLAEHAGEPLDTTWAAAKSEVLGKLLGVTAGAHHFSTVALDCRSATCAATLEWPSYGAAVEALDDLLHDPAVPCGRQLVMPEPPDATARYRTTVLYHDCS